MDKFLLLPIGLIFCALGAFFLYRYQQIFKITPDKARKIESEYFKTGGFSTPLLNREEIKSIERKPGISSKNKYKLYLFIGLAMVLVGFIFILYPFLQP